MSVILSLDATSLLLGGVVLLCLVWWLSIRRPSGLPPGPGPALPLLGHLHLVPKDPRAQFRTWRRQYGDVFSLYMGGKLVMVLASYSAIREALVNFADAFSDRPHIFSIDFVFENKGISAATGPTWKEQRKTCLEILRSMGMGKNVLAERVQEGVTHYIRAIKDHQGAPVDLLGMTQVSVANNICSIAFGKRFQYKDDKFISYINCFTRNVKLLPGTSDLNILPALRHLPGDLFKVKEIMANANFVYSFIDEQLAHHQQSLEENKEKTENDSDFIYSYLHQIQIYKTLGNVDTTLNMKNLRMVLNDLLVAGTETTTAVLLWTMILFLHYPHVQNKCFKEISDVIGPDRPPTMRDKPNLTYLEATAMEVMRKADIVPLSLQHGCAYDVKFRGYVIPKDSVIITDLQCVHQDPEIWGDPENFRPERFIGPDGNLTRREELIPFGIGRRICLGESLARMELFLYLATLIQHFHFLPAEEGQLPSLEGVFGLSYTPQPFKIRAVPRI